MNRVYGLTCELDQNTLGMAKEIGRGGNASTRYLFPSILVRGKFAHMTRLARTVVSGLPHHVTQRGSVRWCCIHQLSSHDFAGSPATPSKITSEKPTSEDRYAISWSKTGGAALPLLPLLAPR
jgi:hypothetical protein